MKNKTFIYLVATLILSVFCSQVYAGEPSEKTFDIRTIKCGKFLNLKEQHRDYVFFFLYGLSSAQKQQFDQSVDLMEKAVADVSDTCIANPDKKVVDILKLKRKI